MYFIVFAKPTIQDPRHSTQDVVRCDRCDTPVATLYCDFCQTNLCPPCVGEHMMDFSKKHRVVQIFQDRFTPNYPSCQIHSLKQCKFHCEQCDIHICALCVSSERHKNHKKLIILSYFERKKHDLQTDLQKKPKNLNLRKCIPSKWLNLIQEEEINTYYF